MVHLNINENVETIADAARKQKLEEVPEQPNLNKMDSLKPERHPNFSHGTEKVSNSQSPSQPSMLSKNKRSSSLSEKDFEKSRSLSFGDKRS